MIQRRPSKIIDDLSLTFDISSDLFTSSSSVGENTGWLYSLPQKPISVASHHRRWDPELSPVVTNGSSLGKALYFERLLELKLNPDPKRNTYIWSTAKDAEKIDCSLYCFPHPSCYPLPLQEPDQTENEVLLPYIYGRELTSPHSLFSIESKSVSESHRRDVASLLLIHRYFHG